MSCYAGSHMFHSWSDKAVIRTQKCLILQTETRRFRMKFSPTNSDSGETRCNSCVLELSKYFPMKLATTGVESQQVNYENLPMQYRDFRRKKMKITLKFSFEKT